MSHFTKVDTKISDLVCLKKTIEELGYKYTEPKDKAKVYIRGWNGNQEEADLKIDTKSSYDIGVKVKDGGMCEVFADWWGVESHAGFTEEEFMQKLRQRYAYNKVTSEVKKQGFTLVEDKVEEDKTIKLVVRKWS